MLREKLVPLTENKMCAEMQEFIHRLMETGESFAIWGAGNTGKGAIAYISECSKGKLAPQCIVDNNPSVWDKDRIISPDQFFGMKERPEILLVCVYVADQIVRQIKENGYKGEVIIFSMTMLSDNKKIWSFYEEHMSELEELYDMLADDRSKETLEGFLNAVKGGSLSYLEKINGDSTEKLLDPAILQYTSEEVFIDIGAFTGDTILKFLELTYGKYKKIMGIEMDKGNYNILSEVTRNMEHVAVKNAAAGAESGRMHFLSGYSESCVLTEDGDSETEVITLDELSEMQDVTFIKISANGMELPILKGGAKLLRRNAPKISSYASGKELWELPRYLKELVPEYKIYYRHYGYGRQAMICYAVKA